MSNIQLTLSDSEKAEAIRALLVRSTRVPVACVEVPNFEEACVVVMDTAHFRDGSAPLAHPERVILITRNDDQHLREAWDAGVHSVLSEQDPLNTVVLAILAVCLGSGIGKQTRNCQRIM